MTIFTSCSLSFKNYDSAVCFGTTVTTVVWFAVYAQHFPSVLPYDLPICMLFWMIFCGEMVQQYYFLYSLLALTSVLAHMGNLSVSSGDEGYSYEKKGFLWIYEISWGGKYLKTLGDCPFTLSKAVSKLKSPWDWGFSVSFLGRRREFYRWQWSMFELDRWGNWGLWSWCSDRAGIRIHLP